MQIEGFFREIDQLWSPVGAEKVSVSIIGSGALMLQTTYVRGTNDSDVFETLDLSASTREQLKRLAGWNTAIHRKHHMFIDLVTNGFPFLPQVPTWKPTKLVLQHLELYALDVVDVVVAKLAPFRPNDQADIDAMIQLDLVPHPRLIERFREAVVELVHEARASKVHQYIDNLHRVERDMLLVDETEIELPSWV